MPRFPKSYRIFELAPDLTALYFAAREGEWNGSALPCRSIPSEGGQQQSSALNRSDPQWW